MTVLISDLVARVRAEGAEQAVRQVQAVGEAAAQTARALQIMADAAAKQSGGTSQGWLEIFQRGNVQPTAAAMAQAAQEMQRTMQAAQQAAPAMQNIARASQQHAEAAQSGARAAQNIADGWKLSDQSLVRFGASLLGVNLGLNVLSGIGRQIHEQLAASVQAAIDLDRVGRGLAATYGAGAASAAAFAQNLAPRAGLTTGGVERALTAAGPLANQYGLSQQQVQSLTARAADIAGRYGVPFEQVFSDVLKSVEGGGNALEQYGVRLDNVYVKTLAWGGALSTTFDRMTEAQQIGARYQILMDQTANSQGAAAKAADTLSGSLDRLAAATQRVREAAGQGLAGPLGGLAGALAAGLNGLTLPPTGPDRRAILGDGSVAPGVPNFTMPGLTSIAGLSGGAPPSFIGPIPLRVADIMFDPSHLLGPANSALAAAQAGIIDAGRASPEQLAEIVRRRAETSFVTAQTAERNRQGNAGLYGQLEVALGQSRDPDERNRISGQLAQLREYQTIQQQIVESERQQATAMREVTEAQARLTQISLVQRQREADVALSLMSIRRQDIQAQRDVLNASTAATGAQLVAQPALNAASALSYGQQRIQLVAQARMARLLQGRSVADLPSLNDLISQNYQMQLAAPETQLAALDASRNVDIAQQGVTRASLRERLAAGPLQQAELTQELVNLEDLPAQTQALHDLVTGQQGQLEAERASREALDKLATLMSNPNFGQTVNLTFSGPVSVRSDQDVADIANQAAHMVLDAITAPSSPPAQSELAGARR